MFRRTLLSFLDNHFFADKICQRRVLGIMLNGESQNSVDLFFGASDTDRNHSFLEYQTVFWSYPFSSGQRLKNAQAARNSHYEFIPFPVMFGGNRFFVTDCRNKNFPHTYRFIRHTMRLTNIILVSTRFGNNLHQLAKSVNSSHWNCQSTHWFASIVHLVESAH